MAKQLWRRLIEFVEYRILHVDDTPHRIALGVAIGFFVAWTPTISIQTIIAIALAALFRANKAVPIPIVWISNPVTAAPIFYANYWLGAAIVGGGETNAYARVQEIGEAGSFLETGRKALDVAADLGPALWVGSVIVGLFLAVVMYPLTKWAVVAYRIRRLARRREKRRGTHPPNTQPEGPHV